MKIFGSFLSILGMNCVVLGLVLSGSNANASTGVSYSLDYTFSGTPPSGAAPWVNVTFEDVTPGTVLLSIYNVSLTGDEFNVDTYLNFNPAKDLSQLSFTYQNGSSGLQDLSVTKDANNLKADGDGYFDIDVMFATPNDGRFEGGDYITYQITGISDLTASDFEFMSTSGGGNGDYFAAAKVQGMVMTSTSAWIGATQPVPEPGSAGLLALAGGFCWLVRRSKRFA